MLLGVKGKVLEIALKKILRPDPGLYSQYFASYDIFCETRIFRHPFSTWFCMRTKNEKRFGYHKKWHNSESIVSTDLGRVSKFSLVQYLKLFLWHPKDLVSRKNVLKGRRKKNIFFWKKCSFLFSLFLALLKRVFNSSYAFGCQGKNFR